MRPIPVGCALITAPGFGAGKQQRQSTIHHGCHPTELGVTVIVDRCVVPISVQALL